MRVKTGLSERSYNILIFKKKIYVNNAMVDTKIDSIIKKKH